MGIEQCERCEEPFNVIELNANGIGNREFEDITCPYCGYTRRQKTSGTFTVIALNEKQKTEYINNQR